MVSPTIHDLGIDRLSAEDRLRLIGEIWDSLSHTEQGDNLDHHREELDRRLAAADADPAAAASWDEVRIRLRSGQ